MALKFREISFKAPLREPLTTQALITENDDAPWRIVVFPGTPCQPALFKRFLRVAALDRQVVVLTRPGFGKGHRAPVLDFAEQVKAGAPFFNDKPVIALGVSYGGALALKAALDRPDAVRGVVSVAALISEPYSYARRLAEFTGAPGVKALAPNRYHKVRAEIEGRRRQIAPLLQDLASLKAPVEVLHGTADHLVSRRDADRLMAALGPSGALETVPGGTHFLELQFPARLHNAVNRAIARAGTY